MSEPVASPPEAPSFDNGSTAPTYAELKKQGLVVDPLIREAKAARDARKVKVLLIIDFHTNWYEEFKGVTLPNGDGIQVEQTKWSHISLVSTTEQGCFVYLRADEHPHPYTSQTKSRTVKVDFCFIRNFPTNLHDTDGFKNILIGLMHAGLPSVNSLHSIFMGMHRPIQAGEMMKAANQIKKVIAAKGLEGKVPEFKVVHMHYYPNAESDQTAEDELRRVCPPTPFPLVVKVSTAHAGYGKIRMTTKENMDDMNSVLKLGKTYYTTEPLVSYEFEYRIQKIGDNYRAFKRNSDTCWKQNWGNLRFEDHPLQDYHIIWVNECAKMFGGMDITGIDILQRSDGTAVALEMNDTANGLMYQHEREDNLNLRDLVLARMAAEFCADLPFVAPSRPVFPKITVKSSVPAAATPSPSP